MHLHDQALSEVQRAYCYSYLQHCHVPWCLIHLISNESRVQRTSKIYWMMKLIANLWNILHNLISCLHKQSRIPPILEFLVCLKVRNFNELQGKVFTFCSLSDFLPYPLSYFSLYCSINKLSEILFSPFLCLGQWWD